MKLVYASILTSNFFVIQVLVKLRHPEEVGQAISELSRELSTNQIALFSHRVLKEIRAKNLHSTRNKSKKNINIKFARKL